jgi:hypothetical protein
MGRGVELVGLRLVRAKTAPHGGLRFLYRGVTGGGEETDGFFHVRAVPSAKGRRLAHAMCASSSQAGQPSDEQRSLRVAYYAAELGLLVEVFPADRHLPSLRPAMDPAVMTPIVAAALGGRRPEHLEIRVLQYKPGRKCLLRYEAKSCKGESALVYGQVYRDVRPVAHHYAAIDAAWRNSVFAIPGHFGVHDGLSMVLSGHLPGRQLSLCPGEAGFTSLCYDIGVGLAEMHQMSVELRASTKRVLDAACMQDWSGPLAVALPQLTESITRTAQWIGLALRHGTVTAQCFVHGDFHVANILVDGGKLGVLDFEHCHMGQVPEDVGYFYAQLKLLALKVFGDHRALDPAARAFLDAYTTRARRPDMGSVPAYCALCCLAVAYFQCVQRPFRSGWFERACALADVARGIASGGGLP